MDFRLAALLLMTSWIAHAFTKLEWSDCGSDPDVKLTNIEATPMPVIFPGQLKLTIQASWTRSLSNVEIHLDVKRHTFLMDLPIPCLLLFNSLHIGSCTYQRECESKRLLEQMVEENWAGIMGDLGSQISAMLSTQPYGKSTECPMPGSNLDIHDHVINLPTMPSILTFFAAGAYKIKITMTDKETHDLLLCLNLAFTFHEA